MNNAKKMRKPNGGHSRLHAALHLGVVAFSLIWMLNSGVAFAQELTFDPPILLGSHAYSGIGLVAADFNKDGHPDIAASWENGSRQGFFDIFIGTGTASFSGPTTSAQLSACYGGGANSADFNGDGNLDLDFVFGGTYGGCSGYYGKVCLGDGAGNFVSPGLQFTGGNSVSNAQAGDFNGDGKTDLATDDNGSVKISFGNGDGTFSGGTSLSCGYDTGLIAVVDFDGNGTLDVVYTCSPSSSVHNKLIAYSGSGTGTFTQTADITMSVNPSGVACGDFNEDGKMDVVVSSYDSSQVILLAGDGLGGFTVQPGAVTVLGQPGGFPAVADFNLDGHLDVAVPNMTTANVSVLPGDGLGGFATPLVFSIGTDTYPRSLNQCDFNQDGFADLAVVTDDGIVLLFNATPPLTVTSPNGGESWTLGSSHDITWSGAVTIASVNIDFSTDNGGNWTSIAAGAANSGSYSWTVPYVVSTQCRVRVSDAADAALFDASDAVFNIFSDGTEPNDDSGSAAVLPIGTTENLIFDGGDNQNPEWYKFFVPVESAGQDLKVNVHVTSPYPDPIPSPEWASDLDFELLDGSLRVLGATISRSDNETLYLHDVASGWYYIYVGYCTTEYADSSSYARYAVTLETGTGFGLGYISGRLVDDGGYGVANEFIFLDPLANDWSISRPYMTSGPDGNFTIAFMPGTYTLLFNNAGKNICGNYTYASPNVVAEYYDNARKIADASHLTIASGENLFLADIVLDTGAIVTGNVANLVAAPLANVQARSYDNDGNTFTYEYALTDASGNYSLNCVPTGGAKVRFSKSGYATEFYDDKPTLGPADTLATQGGVAINGINAQLGVGGTISGSVADGLGAGIGGVRVVLWSVLDSTFSRAVATSASGSGSFSFAKVPAGDYKIYFNTYGLSYDPEWYDDASSFDSASVVSLAEGGTTSGINAQLQSATLTVIAPNGGESWVATTSRNITWTSTGAIANVNIEYSTDGGTTWSDVVVSTPNDGSYSWTIPDTPSANCTVCISDSANPPNADYSDASFTIGAASMPSITVTSPNGGESWTEGSSHDITWTTTGAITAVDIEYSTDGGTNWTSVAEGEANDGRYAWAVPATLSAACLVRVSDAANAAVNDASDAVFAISDDDSYEDNDTLPTAAALAPGSYPGLILRDEDYFKVYVEEGKDLQASVSNDGGVDMDIELYSAGGVLLAESISSAASETLCLSDLAAGWYIVHNMWFGTVEDYTLTLASGDLPLGTVSGRVTDVHGAGIAHVWVSFYDLSGSWETVRGFVPTDANGDYRFAYVAGDHKLQFSCSYPTVDDSIRGKYIDEWYNDTNFAGAQTLSTTAGGALPGIDAVLADAGWITGTVTGPEGQPLYAARAWVYDSGGTYVTGTYTLGDGTYRLGGIAASGNYSVRFRPPSGVGYAIEWYNDKRWSGAADAVSVTVGAETPSINAQLEYGGSISGDVTDAASGLPIANVAVSGRDEANVVIFSDTTDAAGHYDLYWVPACNVKLYFDAGATGYASEWYNNRNDFASADLVAVAAGEAVTGMNAQLALPGVTVTAPNGGESWTAGTAHDITWTSAGIAGGVDILYTYDGGANWTSVAADTGNDGIFPWTVPDTPSANCYVQVLDHADGTPYDGSDAAFSILTVPVETVSAPATPAGPATGAVATSYSYSTGGAVSNLGHGVQYKFDWGDGTDSGWLAVGTTTASHAWAAAGAYNVKAMARCATHTTVESLWSGSYAVVIGGCVANGRDDLLATWDGQGVYYKNSNTGAWVKLASPATLITNGDLDGDCIDDIIGIWPTQGGVWVKYSQSGAWAKLSSTARHIGAGDMNGDGRVELLGTWDGQGVYWRNNTTGAWTKLASAAALITAGDLDNDGTDDLIGIWPTQGGVWVKYSSNGSWAMLSSTAVDIASGDMNGDGRDDLVATWDGQGVYYKNSANGAWVKMASPATQVTAGDLDGDGTDDVIGIWPSQAGVWVKYSQTGSWALLGSTARDIGAGKMRAASGTGSETEVAGQWDNANSCGPDALAGDIDRSEYGPGGRYFECLQGENLEPGAARDAVHVSGPGEPGFTCAEQANLEPRLRKEAKRPNGLDMP